MDKESTGRKFNLSSKKVQASLPVPTTVQAFYWDESTSHFGIAVSPKGKRSWILERRVNGRNVRRKIGDAERLDYKAALAEFRIVDGNLERGVDHVAEAKAAKAAAAAAAAETGLTLAAVLAQYVEQKRRKGDALPLKERTKGEYLAMLAAPRPFKGSDKMTAGGELFALADRRIDKITADDIRAVHAAAEARGARRASYAMQVLRAVLNWQGVTIADNPLAASTAGKSRIALRPSTGAPNPIPPERVRAWWDASFTVRSQEAADLLRLMLLTGARGGEVKAAKVRDADLAGGRLKLIDTKNRSTHTILLSDLGLEIVRRRCEGRKPTALLFDLADAGKTMQSINKAAGMAPEAHTPHDLRATFISVAEELVSAYTLKTMVNHSLRGDVTGGHYVKKSEAQLRAGWQAVADAVTGEAKKG